MGDFQMLGLSEPARPPAPPPPPRRPHSRKVFGQFVFVILLLLSAGGGALAGLVFVHSSNLPQIRQLMEYRPDVMTELYADDGTLIGRFALERRVIVNYSRIPRVLKDAVISVEDRHFESHWGVDVIRILRAALVDIMEWRKAQGASTLTMQLSGRLFLDRTQKSFRRKIREVLLAIQLERHFTKPQIFTLYCNQIPLGHGNFGFAAAAQFYFGVPLDQLSLPEAALLAGLPRSPTAYSPLIYPERALRRRNIVLDAMLANGRITPEEHRRARAAPLGLNVQRWDNQTAPYFVEDVRQFLEKKYGTEAVHEQGLRVYTTLNLRLQEAAERSVREGLHDFDKRRGWRGPVTNILKIVPRLADGSPANLTTFVHDDWKRPIEPGGLVHGMVTEVTPGQVNVKIADFTARLTPADFAWTKKPAPEVFAPGDVDLFQVKEIQGQTLRVSLDQRPQVQGALVAIENSTGAIKAMVGGYDFAESKFNRARQAERQAGSSFKPYVYAMALLEGANPFDTILDAPVSFPSSSGPWMPHNYDYKFKGTITLLQALAESRNVPAVRLLAGVGVDKVIKLCRKFGITSRLAPNLPLALGASDLTLLEHASAFTTFPNDGVRISPRMIYRVTNYDGRVIDEFAPEVSDVLPASIARLEVAMLREVVNSGTGVRAKALKRPVAGKTGTTNDFADAWFIGFTPSLTAGVWVGYDDHRPMGYKEEGGRLALPIWIAFMGEALEDKPVEDFLHSPLLVRPEQVKEILAAAAAERFWAGNSSPPGARGVPRALASDAAARQPGSSLAAESSASTKPDAAASITKPAGAAPTPGEAPNPAASTVPGDAISRSPEGGTTSPAPTTNTKPAAPSEGSSRSSEQGPPLPPQ